MLWPCSVLMPWSHRGKNGLCAFQPKQWNLPETHFLAWAALLNLIDIEFLCKFGGNVWGWTKDVPVPTSVQSASLPGHSQAIPRPLPGHSQATTGPQLPASYIRKSGTHEAGLLHWRRAGSAWAPHGPSTGMVWASPGPLPGHSQAPSRWDVLMRGNILGGNMAGNLRRPCQKKGSFFVGLQIIIIISTATNHLLAYNNNYMKHYMIFVQCRNSRDSCYFILTLIRLVSL